MTAATSRKLAFVFLAMLMALPVVAQNKTTGSVNGVVTDNTGAVLPGVTVTAVNSGTGLTRSAYTEASGAYSIDLLPPGDYNVSAELEGLGKAQRDKVRVVLGTSTRAPLSISPQLTEVIVVTADAPLVDTKQSGLTQVVSSEQISNLPILGRDFKDLVLLTPGVSETFGDRVSLNGGRGITTDYNIDGAEANSDFFGEERGGTEAPFVFSQAAIREFQVIRTAYTAEYSRGAGGTVNAVTKSGSNEILGELFWYRRDAGWASDRNTQDITEFFEAKDADQYGFAFGGPIVRDRFHYFFNADFQDIAEPINVFDWRTDCDFDGALCNQPYPERGLSPEQRTALINKIEGLVGSIDDQLAYTGTDDQETYLFKLDANLSNNHHLSVRGNFADYHNFASESPRMLSNQGDEFNKSSSVVAQAESVLSSNLFNQFILQYSLEERPINPLTTTVPDTTISGGGLFMQFGQSEFMPSGLDEAKWQIKDSVSYITGNHSIKGGFEYLSTKLDNLFPREFSGQYNFRSVQDFLDNKARYIDQGYGETAGLNSYDLSAWGVFIQDTWSPSANLTLDFGLRYDLQDIPNPRGNIYPQYPEFLTSFNNDTDNFAPRFGAAYDIKGDGRSVVRGGIGVFFSPIPSILYAGPLQEVSGGYSRIRVNNPDLVYPAIYTPAQFAEFATTSTVVTVVSPDLENQEQLRTSLAYEQMLGDSYSVSVEGVYADLDKQQRLVNRNSVRSGVMFGDMPLYELRADGRPYPDLQQVKTHISDAEGTYKSITLSAKKVALGDRKFSWLAHYTWSETLTQDNNERSTSSTLSIDPFDPSVGEGRADYDITHRVVLSGTYEFPWGIYVSGILNWNSGYPYSATIDGFPMLNGIDFSATDVQVFVDSNGKVIDLTQFNGLTEAELAAALTGARLQERNFYDQPSFMNIDLRVTKRFSFADRYAVEIIGEVFNAANEKNEYVGSANQEMFDYRLSGGKYTFTRNADFGKVTGFRGSPRQYQLALKFLF